MILAIISALFFWSLHIIKRATVGSQQSSHRWYDRVLIFARLNTTNLLARFSIMFVLIGAWLYWPGIVTQMARIVAGRISVDAGIFLGSVHDALMVVEIKPNILTCGLFAYFFDSNADWIAAHFAPMSKELPPLVDIPATQIMDAADIKKLVSDNSQ